MKAVEGAVAQGSNVRRWPRATGSTAQRSSLGGTDGLDGRPEAVLERAAAEGWDVVSEVSEDGDQVTEV